MNRTKALTILSLVSFSALLGSAGLLVYGSDMGEDNGISPERRSMHGFGYRLDLTDEQREALHTRVQEMRDDGAGQEEIRAEVATMLDGWGIDPPECQGPSPTGMGNGFRFHRQKKGSV